MRKMKDIKQKICRKIERCVLLMMVTRDIIEHDKDVQTIAGESAK